ncbi:FlxA-like family protein [Lachnospiraceae bacterium 45-W7]
MKISGIGVQANPISGLQGMDQASKNIQRQISEKQKQLQELSANDEIAVEEKMKKRQEIQKEITDLNCQLRQHQIEQRKEKQQVKGASMEDMLGDGKKTEGPENRSGHTKTAGISQDNMKTMLTADAAIQQAKVYGGAASDLQGKTAVLEIEIKQDAARGGNVEQKQEELAKAEAKAQNAVSAQISELAEANNTANSASEEVDEKENEQENMQPKPGRPQEDNAAASQKEQALPEGYTPVDMRL